MYKYGTLEHEEDAWSVDQAARFLGYSTKYVYELIRDNKIEGWFEVNGKLTILSRQIKSMAGEEIR